MVNCDPTKMMAVAGCSVMMGTANSPQPGAELVNLGWEKRRGRKVQEATHIGIKANLYIITYIDIILYNYILVGEFKPSEKYESQLG